MMPSSRDTRVTEPGGAFRNQMLQLQDQIDRLRLHISALQLVSPLVRHADLTEQEQESGIPSHYKYSHKAEFNEALHWKKPRSPMAALLRTDTDDFHPAEKVAPDAYS